MTNIKLIGIYSVPEQKDVHLIELKIFEKPSDIEIGEFTQEMDGVDRMDWQSPYDEKYLDDQGTKITGDWLNVPEDSTETTRIIFFFHYLDLDKPLITPFGSIELTNPEQMPGRLASMVEYEEP